MQLAETPSGGYTYLLDASKVNKYFSIKFYKHLKQDFKNQKKRKYTSQHLGISYLQDGFLQDYKEIYSFIMNCAQIGSSLKIIRRYTFKGVNFKNTLAITNCVQLSQIEDHSFERMTELQSLTLSSNKLEVITNGTFRGLYSLETLMLDNNAITYISSDAFKDLSSLQILQMDKNDISSIGKDTFKHLKSLSELYLTSNRLATLTGNQFYTALQLSYVYLNDNILERIPGGIFNYTKKHN